MWFERLGRRFVVSSVQVPLVGFVENVEPFVLLCIVVASVVRQVSILVVVATTMVCWS